MLTVDWQRRHHFAPGRQFWMSRDKSVEAQYRQQFLNYTAGSTEFRRALIKANSAPAPTTIGMAK